MTSRERVAAAFRHEEPDRMPIDFGSGSTCGIMGVAYRRLKDRLGLALDKPVSIYSLMMQLAVPDMEVIQRLHGDVIPLDYRYHSRFWKPWSLADGTPALIPDSWNIQKRSEDWVVMDGERVDLRMTPGCHYFDRVEPPLAKASKCDIDRWQMPPIADEDLEYLGRMSRELYDGTRYCIKSVPLGSIYEGAHALRGIEQWYMDLVTDRPFAEALMDKLCEGCIRDFDLFHEAVQGRCDVIWVGDDLGTQNGPQISPALYHELIWPRHKRFYQHIKRRAQYRLVLHSCGSIMPFLEDLIEAGIDGINPVQITAANMDPHTLKERYGKRLLFWGGGVDTQHILQNGTPQKIRGNVHDLCAIFKPGGGFVWNPIHNLQATVPPENIVAAYDAAWECAGY
jgi:uroporphyrinogen decarboxylase